MFRLKLLAVLVVTLACVTLSAPTTNCSAEETAEERNAAFMQAKLTYAQNLLEGLALEDYDAIGKNAQKLSLLSLDSTWQVFQTPEYVRQSAEFRRTTDAITKAGEKKNLDSAALYYMEMTMKCIQCHKYVRSTETPKLRSILDRIPAPKAPSQ